MSYETLLYSGDRVRVNCLTSPDVLIAAAAAEAAAACSAVATGATG